MRKQRRGKWSGYMPDSSPASNQDLRAEFIEAGLLKPRTDEPTPFANVAGTPVFTIYPQPRKKK